MYSMPPPRNLAELQEQQRMQLLTLQHEHQRQFLEAQNSSALAGAFNLSSALNLGGHRNGQVHAPTLGAVSAQAESSQGRRNGRGRKAKPPEAPQSLHSLEPIYALQHAQTPKSAEKASKKPRPSKPKPKSDSEDFEDEGEQEDADESSDEEMLVKLGSEKRGGGGGGSEGGCAHGSGNVGAKPKQPMNAFMLYRQHVGPGLKAQNPTLTLSETNQRLSADWHALKPHLKDAYIRKAKEAQLAYLTAKREFGRQQFCCAGLTAAVGREKMKGPALASKSQELSEEWNQMDADAQDKWMRSLKRREAKLKKIAQ